MRSVRLSSLRLLPCVAGLCSFLALPAFAAPAVWSVSVEQGGQVLPEVSELRLKKSPFSLVFTGPADLGYAVLASHDCADFAGLKTKAQIAAVIRPDALASESEKPEDNLFLLVNGPGAIKSGDNSAQAWSEEPEAGTHSFQVLKPGADKTLRATREIREILLHRNYKDTPMLPLAQYPYASICLFFTGLPPVGHMAHESPRMLQLRFD